jgi:acylglycerol lipase
MIPKVTRNAKNYPTMIVFPRALFPALLLPALALSACAPVVRPMGPETAEPRIENAEGEAPVLVARDGMRLPMQVWRPPGGKSGEKPKAMILALHGFNDYANGIALPAAWWAARGIESWAFDQRGFGRAPHRGYWAGTAAMTADLRTAAAALKGIHPEAPLFLVGVSMGGAVTMAALADGPIAGVDGAILVGPAVWGRAYMPWYQRLALRFFSNTVPWFTVTGEGLNRQPSDNIPMLRKLSRDPHIIRHTRIDAIRGLVDLMDSAQAAASRLNHTKVLMIYGLRDEIVPKKPVLDAMRNLPGRAGSKRAVYSASWHMMLRDLKAEIVWRDIAGWMLDAARPLQSGADAKAEDLLANPENSRR